MQNIEMIKKRVEKYEKKLIKLDALRVLVAVPTYKDFVVQVKSLEAEGVLRPVRSSKLNGRNPALYKRYHILNEYSGMNYTACPVIGNRDSG